jgi:DNA-nicking Smr family endonuclease
MARVRGLSKSDLRLWAAFTETIALLPGKERLPVEAAPVAPADVVEMIVPHGAAATPRGKAVPVELGANLVPGGLDKSTWKNFATGKIRTARRLDLHGLTATRAHTAVINFIERAYGEQIRCVEIITGKGEVLARELPHWLNSPVVRGRILAVAHPHAGNTGSVRLLLRRDRQVMDARLRRHDGRSK